MSQKGKLIVISGPSGAGKSTVLFKAIEGRKDVCFSTSVTTRKPRPGEQDGREYFFIHRDRFEKMIENDELLEHAVYVENYYGTPRAYVQEKMEEGFHVVLDIEVQGARQVNEKMPEAVKVFIIPPSMEELERRLRGRGDTDEEQIQRRLARGKWEMEQSPKYEYIVINDQVEACADEILHIIAEKAD